MSTASSSGMNPSEYPSPRRLNRHIIWIILLLLGGSSCRSRHEIDNPIRFVDLLSAEDVIRSPLKNLHTRFPRHSERILPEAIQEIGTTNIGNPLLAFSPTNPVLVDDPSLTAPGIKVYVNDREIPRQDELSPQIDTWSYLGKNREIQINRPFFKGADYETDIILPAGRTKFYLYASNRQPKDYRPHLNIMLNGRRIGHTAVENDLSGEIIAQTELKKYRLAVTCDTIDNSLDHDERGMIFQLHRLRIEAPVDLLFLTPSEKDLSLDGRQNYHIEYYSMPPDQDPSWKRNPSLPFLSTLFHLTRSSPLEDFGVKKLPFPMKTKLRIGATTTNAVLAPTQTEFRRRVRVPDEAQLEFIWGLIPESGTPRKSRVEFILKAVDGKQTTILFQERMNIVPGQEEIRFHQKSIDLTSLSGRTITFHFITRKVKTHAADRMLPVIAFWGNPMLTVPRRKDKEFNVILISLDTLRADHLGTYGYPLDTSPHINALAQECVQFNQHFSTAPWTLPAHMSLFTSKPVSLHKIHQNHQRLNPEIITLAEILKTQGYTTGAFTGGGYVGAGFGFDRGFDFYQDRDLRGHKGAERLFTRTSKWIRENKKNRFFLFLHTYQIHGPYTTPAPFNTTFLKKNHAWKKIHINSYLGGPKGIYKSLPDHQRENVIALYDGEILYTDEILIAPLIKLLKDIGLYDQTLIVLTSDHGEEFYEHGAWLHGQSLFNELIRIPLLIKKPFQKDGGAKRGDPANIMDIAPTILGQLGIKVSASNENFKGIDLFKYSIRKDKPPRSLIGEIYRARRLPTPFPGADDRLQQAAVVEYPYKLIVVLNYMINYYFYSPQPPFKKEMVIELYDLSQDPQEKNNIASRKPEVVQRLWKQLEQHFQKGIRDDRSPNVFSKDEALQRRLRALGYIE